MYRIYEERIQKWIDESRKALLIYGARQVGKTYLIREMLKRNNISYCEYNFVERTDILEWLSKAEDAGDISNRLALYSDVPLKEGESVIFLDEIQKYPDIVSKIKFLVDEGKYRYILSGSNLGVELKNIRSIPVGYVDEWQMMPMNYEEFALNSGISGTMIEHMRDCYRSERPVDDIVHKKLLQAFYYYLVSGGMPTVVREYNASHNLERIDKEQRSIINQYKADFTQYELKENKLRIRAVYDNIPSQLNKQNRRFVFSELDKELKFDRYENSFLWLKDAAVAIPAYIVSEPESPLRISSATNVFKLFMSDVGLLTCCYPLSVKREIISMDPNREINNGSLFENFVAQELYASGYELYYYKRKGVGEVDFIIDRDDMAVPVEVKSGNDYKKHSALNHLLDNYRFEKAYVLYPGNTEIVKNITYLPIYMAGLLGQSGDNIGDIIIPAL
ncbi:MAG: ATP-binding protein [Lachnospiraceae bacterium]|nr:ATP-binding protein [Lachnospiraceae bacterium]